MAITIIVHLNLITTFVIPDLIHMHFGINKKHLVVLRIYNKMFPINSFLIWVERDRTLLEKQNTFNKHGSNMFGKFNYSLPFIDSDSAIFTTGRIISSGFKK